MLKFVFLYLICGSVTYSQEILTQPEQIHLSYGSTPSEMVITWVTLNQTYTSLVEYGFYDGQLKMKTVSGSQKRFEDGGDEKRKIYVHRVHLTDLIPNKKYGYRTGCEEDGWSALFFLTAMKAGSEWSGTYAVVGDMGNINAQALTTLQTLAQAAVFDAVLHVGDFAYDMDTDNARVGDAYMKQAQSFAAYLPYMTCAGNHEQAYNFSNYKERFSMPGGDGQGMFYSVNIGLMHLVAFNSEFFYFPKYGWKQIERQYDWLQRDLMEANKPENRAKRPWIVTMCHRPMYCSNSNDKEHCNNPLNMIRVGLPGSGTYNTEDLLYKYAVDLHFQAHEHSYERMWPVYNKTVCNGSHENPYKNPRSPVHIVTGSGGCKEGLDPFERLPHAWSAFHADDYGYSVMNVHNHTHLSLQQISIQKGNSVIDSIVIEKDTHAAGQYDCHKQPPPPTNTL